MSLNQGTRLGPYEIATPLGAGGMGEVYRARDTRLGRDVAIKVVSATAAGDAQMLHRLEQEARTIAALNHPNLLSVYDVGTTPEGHPYLVSELLEGQPLRQRLAAGPLPQAKAVEYALQIARGLAAAHDKGIVHRDLKPENLFVTDDGRVKILDFGLAKIAAQAAGEEKTVALAATTPGTVLGTVGYMAPEQVKGQPADARSDLFSLGAVLYEMLAGRRAFTGDSAVEVMSAILKEEPEPLDTISTGKRAIAPGLDRIVRHCLEKEPRQRFQSASDVAFSLSDLSSAGTTAALPVLSGPATRRWQWPAVTAVLVAVAAGAAWVAARAGVPTGQPVFHALTAQRGIITGARFLPGDQGFVLSARWNGDAQDHLFTGRLDAPGLQPVNLTGQEVAGISSDGGLLLLSQGGEYEYAGVGTLSQAPVAGGAPRPLYANVTAAQSTPSGQLILVRRDPQANRDTLEYPPGHVLYATGGWISAPHLSPNGQLIGFLDHPAYGDDGGRAAVVDLKGHERNLSPMYPTAQGLGWSPNGREVWFAAADNSDRQLYAATLSGKVRVLLSTAVPFVLDDVAPDGRLLLTASDGRYSSYAATLSDPQPRDLSIMSTSELRQLSPDGRQALIVDFSAGKMYGSYLRGSDGGPPQYVGEGTGVALSPDGQWVLSVLPDGRAELLPTGAGEPRPVMASGVNWLRGGGFLPDSRHAVAVGTIPGQGPRLYLLGLDGHAVPVTAVGIGASGVWPTPDGKYALAQNASLAWFLYPLAGGAPVPVPRLQPQDRVIRFGSTNDEVYLSRLSQLGSQSQIYRLALGSGRSDLVATIHPNEPGLESIGSMAISSDGKTYGYTLITEVGTLFVVTGVH